MPKHAPARVRRWQATAILTLFFIAVAGAAAIGWWYARESPPHQGPIVVISVDGLDPATLTAYGASPGVSPGLDALAGEAVVFERAYTHSPEILPAHASLLSGQLPFQHGVRDNGGFELTGKVRTLAELLRNRGFSTGAAVSSFLLRRQTGVGQGFSFFDDEGGADGQAPEGAALARPGNLTLDAAEAWVRTQDDRRYFLLVQVEASDADVAVTRLTKLLEERKMYDESTIVLVGDRGPAGAPSMEEESLRVPLLVKQPLRDGAGRRVRAPVQHIDIAPTILDLVRAPIPGDLRGRSLKPVLNSADGRLTPQPIYSESLAAFVRFGGHPTFALTVSGSRYVRGGAERVTRIDPPVDPTSLDESDVARVSAPPDPIEAEGPADEFAPLRATLDRILARQSIAPAVPPAQADRDRLATAGYLPGLQPAVVADDERLTEAAEQEAVAAAHQEAARLAGERRLPASIRALQTILRTHPSLASVHFQVGLLSMELGRTASAIAAFRQAAILQPDAPEVPRELALALARGADAENARAQAALAVELAAGSRELVAAHETAARVALMLGDPASALASAASLQSVDPSVPMRAFVEGTLSLEEERYEEAARMLGDAGAMLRQHGSALEGLQQALGEALTHLGRHGDAEAAFREELRAFPHSLDTYVALATLYRTLGQDAAAEAVIDELLLAVPTPEGYGAAARLWTDLGARSRAEAIRSDARARFRGEPSSGPPGRDTRR
jgi:tetratricopeptide (TPR) repeat protein